MIASVIIFLIGVIGNNVASAYLTAQATPMDNPFTIALSVIPQIDEQFEPDKIEPDTTIKYQKEVSVKNAGYIDGYIRVRLDFSSADIADKSYFSSDGTHFYHIAEYQKGGQAGALPSEWVYNADDGYYYYTKPLKAGNATTNQPATDTPVISYVKTEFGSWKEVESYNIGVRTEGCPTYLGSTYDVAWKEFAKQASFLKKVLTGSD